MKAAVFGAGMMGSALAYDLANSEDVESVILGDIHEMRAGTIAKQIGEKVIPKTLDINDYDDVVRIMGSVDVTVGATTYNHNLLLTRAAIEAESNFCDLGGNMDVVDSQLELDVKARAAGIRVLPNCGLAPGMACVIAAGAARRFKTVEELHIRVGGLPQHPKPPLNYQLVFSAEGLINEYIEPAEVIRGGDVRKVESMTDREELEFPPPFGTLEAFNTSGGISTLTRMFSGKVKDLDYKTIRYKGHCEKFKTLLDLGFASSEPMTIGSRVCTAREFFEDFLRKKLPASDLDVVLMRIVIKGNLDGLSRTLEYEMVDFFDETNKITSMMRTTAFPTSIIAQMLSNGLVNALGVMPPEQCVPLDPFILELKKRNIMIKETIS